MTTQMKVRAEAKLRKERSKNTTKASGEERSKRPRPSRTVRLDDRNGFDHKFNGSGLQSEVLKDLYYFGVKCYEQVLRGNPLDSVATDLKKQEFHQFRKYAKPEFLEPLPEGFDLSTKKQKLGALKKLLVGFMNTVSPMLNQDAGMTQGNYPDREGSAATIANQGNNPYQSQGYEGTAPTVIANLDADMIQGNFPDNMRNDEGTTAVFPNQDVDIAQEDYHESTHGCAADPVAEAMGNMSYLVEALSQKVARHQLDKPQGRPPPSPDYRHQCPDELFQGIGILKLWASRSPEIFREIEVHEKGLMSCVRDLYDRDLFQAPGADSRILHVRSWEKEIFPEVEEDITTADPQNQLSMPSTEDGSSWVTCHHYSDYVLDVQLSFNSSPPQGKQDGLISNQAISEAPEEVPRHTRHLKLSGTDIHPQVYGGRLIGSLEHHPPKQFLGSRGSHPQVYDPGDMQTGGEKFMTQSFGGLNNTSAIAGMDYSLSAELPGVGQATWAAEMQNPFDTASSESFGGDEGWTSRFLVSTDHLDTGTV